MQNNTRNSAEIERDIARERAQLSEAVRDLQNRFSVENIFRELSGQVRSNGLEVAQSFGRSAKNNPLALTLTGIGLAWLMFGNNQDNGRHDNNGRRPVRGEPLGWESGYASRGVEPRGSVTTHGDSSSTGATARAGAMARSAGKSASSTAADARARISEGTEALSREARARVLAAREAALDARERAEKSWRKGQEVAVHAFENNPLAMGTVAMALGAVLGSALPRTDIENRTMGDESDRLYGEAERIFREETVKASRAAKKATTGGGAAKKGRTAGNTGSQSEKSASVSKPSTTAGSTTSPKSAPS
jgi:hypothetical protein